MEKIANKEFGHWAGYTVSYLILKKRLAGLKKADWNWIMAINLQRSSAMVSLRAPQIHAAPS